MRFREFAPIIAFFTFWSSLGKSWLGKKISVTISPVGILPGDPWFGDAMSTTLSIPTSRLSTGNSAAAELQGVFKPGEHAWTTEEIDRHYDAIARDPHYFQFANIPRRIIECLESLATVIEREAVHARLLAYYVFIGVVDDEIESAQFEIGEITLRRLANPLPCFDRETRASKSQFMTEVLKQHIDPGIHSQVLHKFTELLQANLAERRASTMKGYIEQRKLVGRLTAELSYLLVQNFLSPEQTDCRELMMEVGAVGCLVDSVFDARADKRDGALSFRPSWLDFLRLGVATIFKGIMLVVTHPRMLPLFADAMRDNFYDRLRPHVCVIQDDSACSGVMK